MSEFAKLYLYRQAYIIAGVFYIISSIFVKLRLTVPPIRSGFPEFGLLDFLSKPVRIWSVFYLNSLEFGNFELSSLFSSRFNQRQRTAADIVRLG